METQREKQTQTQKNVFTMISGGFMIAVRNNSLNDSIAFFRAYLVTILKALVCSVHMGGGRVKQD